MRKGRDGEKREKRGGTDENSGHYVIASSRPPERRPLERRTLAPIQHQQQKPQEVPIKLILTKTKPNMNNYKNYNNNINNN